MRPRSLAEAIDQHRTGRDFGVALNEFLDEFYLADAERQDMIEQEPALIGDHRLDSYIGAIGEHLAQRWHLDAIPQWTFNKARFLDWPWFPDGDSPKLRMILLMESPIAFRRRDIYTEAEPLRRARMPRDSRAIANEMGL
jgi:hypothetical protein